MMRTIVFLLVLLGIVNGKTTNNGTTPTSTASAPGATKTFSVGADGRTFTPHEQKAAIGDIIEYRFYPQNHSVVKAAFGPEPCIPYELTGAGRVGWWSGWMPVNVVTSDPPIFRIRINDTNPLFFYCSSPGACLEGMVGVVNPNSTQTYEAQLAHTQNATASLSPGEFFPEEKLNPSTTTGGTRPTISPGTNNEPHTQSLSGGAIAGIVIGSIAILALLGISVYMYGRQRTFKEVLHSPSTTRDAYHPTTPGGVSQVQYPNLLNTPEMTDSTYNAQTYGSDSYRSGSPQISDRGNGMVDMMVGHMSPDSMDPRWPISSPKYEEMQEMDQNASGNDKRLNIPPATNEIHELAAAPENVALPSQSPVSRRFSFSNEVEHMDRPRGDRIDTMQSQF